MMQYIRAKASERGISRYVKLALVYSSCFLAIFFSPVTRIFSNVVYWPYIRMSGGNVGESVGLKFGQTFYNEQIQTAELLKPLLGPQETVFVWGNSVGIYFRLDHYPSTICLTNTPFVTSWTIKNWKDTLIRQLQNAPPKFFIIETGDARDYITGDTLDSRQHLQQWSELNNFVATKYHDFRKVGHFVIEERN
jgi:hypothetical protein